MNYSEILSRVDHTDLTATANEADIIKLCEEAIKYKTASVCIAPCYVRAARHFMDSHQEPEQNSPAVCTVIGFPNGNNTTASKVFETLDAIANGAQEINMVVNISWLSNNQYDDISREISLIRRASEGDILKVMFESCMLNKDDEIKMCNIISESGADFIGLSSGNAIKDELPLLKQHLKNNVKIYADGVVRTINDAKNIIQFGADRLVANKVVKLMMDLDKDNVNYIPARTEDVIEAINYATTQYEKTSIRLANNKIK